MIIPDKVVRTTCPYCGVGCQINLNIKDNTIYGMLCVKGRFGTDYVNHPRRAKIPDYKNTAVSVTKTTPPNGWSGDALLSRGAIKEPVQVQ